MTYGNDSFIARYPDGRRVTLRVKRDVAKLTDLDPGERLRAMLKMFPNPAERETRSVFEEIFRVGKADDRDEIDRDDDGGGGASDHVLSRLADLLVESGRFIDRGHALRHLTSHPDGVALVRTHKAKDDPPMKDTVLSIMKDCGGPVAFAKTICDTGRSYGVSEQEYVEAASRHAGELYGLPGDRAFAKLCENEGSVVVRACAVLKAAEFSVFDIKPVVVSGTNARDVDNATAAVRAYEEIVRIGREKFPFLPADQQFARVFEDSKYAALAAQAHSRPAPSTIYQPPAAQGTAYTKSADPAPNADTAYGELMLKAQAYRDAHPELSISQAFEKIFTAPANRELAKRERVESRPR